MQIVRRVVLPSVLVGVVAVAVAFAVAGADGALGAAVGAVAVLLFLGSSPAVVGAIASLSTAQTLPAALVLYSTKVVAAVLVVLVLADADGIGRHVDPQALGLAVIATSLTWTTLHVVALQRSRVPTYDLGAEE